LEETNANISIEQKHFYSDFNSTSMR
jgi:hypothetical protein